MHNLAVVKAARLIPSYFNGGAVVVVSAMDQWFHLISTTHGFDGKLKGGFSTNLR
ncbi:hypothetical protein SOVF_201670 [Spinacia oleracea]|nr:hypothetical protein SOVF_201670 [Spinacia oleracea]